RFHADTGSTSAQAPAPASGSATTNSSGKYGTETAGREGIGNGVGTGQGDSPISIDEVAEPPVLVSSPMPEYPEAACRAGLEGEVVLRIIVDKIGKVEPNVVVVQSLSTLDQPAIRAVLRWRFSPGRDNDGAAVRVELEVPMRFQLQLPE
ncbi:MAG TPA: energy transducer TonB, partial [Thermoanaerobaculia bacterium]|nr:energy transducer TonB [Thermoanaerobaculia bacterium]